MFARHRRLCRGFGEVKRGLQSRKISHGSGLLCAQMRDLPPQLCSDERIRAIR